MTSERRPHDFYATPSDVIELFLQNFDLSLFGKEVLEPSAGNGNIITAVKVHYPDKKITAVELRGEELENLEKVHSDTIIIDNFLSRNFNQKYDIIIGNPPFSDALGFVEKSLTLLKENGVLIFLLKTSFLESKARHQFWQDNPLTGLYTLSKRPSFTGKGTDQASYSWFVWCPSYDNQEIKVI